MAWLGQEGRPGHSTTKCSQNHGKDGGWASLLGDAPCGTGTVTGSVTGCELLVVGTGPQLGSATGCHVLLAWRRVQTAGGWLPPSWSAAEEPDLLGSEELQAGRRRCGNGDDDAPWRRCHLDVAPWLRNRRHWNAACALPPLPFRSPRRSFGTSEQDGAVQLRTLDQSLGAQGPRDKKRPRQRCLFCRESRASHWLGSRSYCENSSTTPLNVNTDVHIPS